MGACIFIDAGEANTESPQVTLHILAGPARICHPNLLVCFLPLLPAGKRNSRADSENPSNT